MIRVSGEPFVALIMTDVSLATEQGHDVTRSLLQLCPLPACAVTALTVGLLTEPVSQGVLASFSCWHVRQTYTQLVSSVKCLIALA